RGARGRGAGDWLGHGAQVPARRTDDPFRPEIRPQRGGPAPNGKEAREPLAASRVEQRRAQALVLNDEGLSVDRPAQASRNIGCRMRNEPHRAARGSIPERETSGRHERDLGGIRTESNDSRISVERELALSYRGQVAHIAQGAL